MAGRGHGTTTKAATTSATPCVTYARVELLTTPATLEETNGQVRRLLENRGGDALGDGRNDSIGGIAGYRRHLGCLQP
jgi:hypothetical protein